MQLEDKAELQRILTGVSQGCEASVRAWFNIAERPVRSIVVRALSTHQIWADRDRLHDIVMDAVEDLGRVSSRSWSPDGGAMPWGWASDRIRSVAFKGVGTIADDLDNHLPTIERRTDPDTLRHDERSGRAVLNALSHQPTVRLLIDALHQQVSERDQNIWLEVELEKQANNQSPAETVAKNHDTTPGNVRQVCCRVRRSLRQAGQRDSSLAPILALPCIAA